MMSIEYSHLILFDGVCNLCNSSVRFVLERDRKGIFHFSALQSEAGLAFLHTYCEENTDLESIVYIENGQCYTKSEAVIRIARHLSGAWPIVSISKVIPVFIRDWLYNRIASNRYRWFGRLDVCSLSIDGYRERFIMDEPE